MKSSGGLTRVVVGCAMFFTALVVCAQDWPQWRGPNRDGHVTGFKAPATWPKELTKKWQVTVGNGVSTPALVGERLYVLGREGGDEVLRALDAATGMELWQDKIPTPGPTGGASQFPGPRSSPTVANGKIVTLNVRGTVSCYDAASGKVIWRKEGAAGFPTFFTSCSPLVVDGLCIVQTGSEKEGGIVAFDLESGSEKWKWTGDGTAYSSPVPSTLFGMPVIVAETQNSVVVLSRSDGKLLSQTAFPAEQRVYNACTPIVDGTTVMFAGKNRGARAVTIEKQGDQLTAKEAWKSTDNSVQFNTPILRDGLLFGLSDKDSLFCIDAKTGKTMWTTPLAGRGGRLTGYGSIVSAGPVLIALNPAAQLVVFEPTGKEFKEIIRYPVSEKETFAYPIISGNRIFIKDQDSLTLFTLN